MVVKLDRQWKDTTQLCMQPPDGTPPLMPVRTSKYLSRYECARLIGLRLLQLQDGDGVANPWETAMQEIRDRANPGVIRRYLPDGRHEDVAASNLLCDRFMMNYQLTPTPTGKL